MSDTHQNDCQCELCRKACEFKSGWFMPGEAEKAAEFLGVTLKEFFDQHLGVDWFTGDGGATFLLAPALVDEKSGTEYPGDPRGKCVFFKNGLCSIHAVKPFECRAAQHTDAEDYVQQRHAKIAKAWESNQNQIEELLGREPESQDWHGGGILGSLFDSWWS